MVLLDRDGKLSVLLVEIEQNVWNNSAMDSNLIQECRQRVCNLKRVCPNQGLDPWNSDLS